MAPSRSPGSARWWPFALAIVCVVGRPLAAQIRSVDVTQVTRPVVEVRDSTLIAYLLFELFIEPLARPTRLQVIDVTQNGFGPDDIIVAHPSGEAFLIPEFLPDSVQTVMSGWVPDIEYRLDSGNLPIEALGALIGGGDTTQRAENAIMYDVVQAVERNYRDLPVGILFRRDSVGFTFQLWDYVGTAMHYTPRPAFVADSTVTAVLTKLHEVGYVPGQNVVPTGRALDLAKGAVVAVDRALLGTRALREEPMRQLAARTVLLGSYDADRSGAIDRAPEIDAVPCSVWIVLDGTFPELVERFGFADRAAPYLGDIVLGISANVRIPAGRRAGACLDGAVPPPTPVADVVPVERPAPPRPVADFLGLETAAAVVRSTTRAQPGSAEWIDALRSTLLARFDTDGSGALDEPLEIAQVPCSVWQAIAAAHGPVVAELGLDGNGRFDGLRIGVSSAVRDVVASRIRPCAEAQRETVARRLRVQQRSPTQLQTPSAAAPLRGLSAVQDEPRRQFAAKTILVAAYDADRSGTIDTADELDAVSCDVWKSLEVAFPRFVDTYGFLASPESDGLYRGALVFNISERLRAPAASRALACLKGETPQPTAVARAEEGSLVIHVPAELRDFMDASAAARIARASLRSEPGTAGWAAGVRDVLLEEYDLDGSGSIDLPDEVEEVPCVVWNTVTSTYGAVTDYLRLQQAGGYAGGGIGVGRGLEDRVLQRIRRCAS